MAAPNALDDILSVLKRNRNGRPVGVCSVCTAHPLALEAAMIQAKNDDAPALVEATANQVNQFGGYTGLRPADFPRMVAGVAERVGLPPDRIVLGGDHLGPVCWTGEPAAAAMAKARDLVAECARAGFLKLHLDTSMALADDAEPLGDELVARRAADLCAAAEAAARACGGERRPVYVVGTEVPPPGGARKEVGRLEVTTADRARRTVAVHRKAFAERGLSDAWPRVVGLVVQPGVEFDHVSVHRYEPERASALGDVLNELPGIVYEAHSTDYQLPESYRALLADHFAILKVGPQLTFALREALFALSAIEEELLGAAVSSRLPSVCERAMRKDPGQWIGRYPARGRHARWHRRYSYSDRIRYYWNRRDVAAAVERMFGNLSGVDIPLPLLSQHLPAQYEAVRQGSLAPAPRDLAVHHVMEITSAYSVACRGID